MNIIIVYDFGSVNGGAAQVAISSAIALKNAGNNVVYFCAVKPTDNYLSEHGVEVVCSNQLDIKSDPNTIRKSIQGIWNVKARKMLKVLLKRFSSADTIVHFHGWSKALSPSVLGVPNKMGFHSFITLHDFFTYCPNGGLYNYQTGMICDCQPMSMKCMLCNCDRDNYSNKIWRVARNLVQNMILPHLSNNTFISISDCSTREFKRCYRFRNNYIVRVNNPVTFPTVSNVVDSIKDSYLFMARLSKEKGVDLFCQALTIAGVKGIVLGDGPLKDKLQKDYPNVEFAGWVSDNEKENYLSRTRAFVFSSVWFETFGLSVAEMLSVGIPCIVGDKTAAAEIIEDGKNGLLFRTGDLNSLVDAIKKMDTHYSNYSDIVFPKSDYSIEQHVVQLISAYQKVCGSSIVTE